MSDIDFAIIRDRENIWKHEQIRGYCVAFLSAGLRLLEFGVSYVGSDDVNMDTEGPGIAGSAVTMLRSAHVIADYFGHHPDVGVIHGRRKSKRESANGRKIALYKVNRALAEEWLRRNGISLVPRQAELFERFEITA